jgi:CHASE2 domain-containing sensor protein
MLNQQQAAQIALDCIRAVSHVPDVNLAGTLDDAGIIDAARVNNVVTLIVNSPNIGVPSEQHRISAGFFNGVGSDAVVFQVIDIIRDNSVPVHPDPLEEFASLVARHLADRMKPAAKSSAGKGAKKSSGAKKAKKGSGKSKGKADK